MASLNKPPHLFIKHLFNICIKSSFSFCTTSRCHAFRFGNGFIASAGSPHQTNQTTLHFRAKEGSLWLVSSLIRLDLTNKETMLLFVCSEAVESKLVTLETSRAVILPPMVSVL